MLCFEDPLVVPVCANDSQAASAPTAPSCKVARGSCSSYALHLTQAVPGHSLDQIPPFPSCLYEEHDISENLNMYQLEIYIHTTCNHHIIIYIYTTYKHHIYIYISQIYIYICCIYIYILCREYTAFPFGTRSAEVRNLNQSTCARLRDVFKMWKPSKPANYSRLCLCFISPGIKLCSGFVRAKAAWTASATHGAHELGTPYQ